MMKYKLSRHCEAYSSSYILDEGGAMFNSEVVKRLNSLTNENKRLMEKLDFFQKRTIDLGEELDYAKDDSEEVSRLCRVIAEDKGTIASLEEKKRSLEEVIEKQNALIETLWELYTQEGGVR